MPTTRTRLGPSWASCPDKPTFHLLPRSGWVNDPNGLVLDHATRRFHAFYQHVPGRPAWAWGGLSWGHASSSDLTTWRHEPVALVPSPGGADAAGCWSGCAVPGVPGEPASPRLTLLFTGVSLRAPGPHARSPSPHFPPTPPNADLGLEQHECQLAAVLADEEGDEHLRVWVKRPAPIIPHAPPGGLGFGGGLVGFRDPFVVRRWAGDGAPWRLVVGSGVKGGRGCLLAYASSNPDPGAAEWTYEGAVCGGDGVVVRAPEVESSTSTRTSGGPPSSPSAVDAIDIGEMWECPFIVPLIDGASGRAFTLVCVSPYPHRSPAAKAGLRPTNPPLFWLVEGAGHCCSPDLTTAVVGPLRLDLGDTLYAPTVAAGFVPEAKAAAAAAGAATAAAAASGCGGGWGGACGVASGQQHAPTRAGEAAQRAVIMMGWLQELRAVSSDGGPSGDASATTPSGRARDYAGCLSLAREVSVRVGADGVPALHQAPVNGLCGLRLGNDPPAWDSSTLLQPGAPPVPIPGAVGDAVDLELTLERPGNGGEAGITGLWLRASLVAAGDAPPLSTPTAVALLANWGTANGGGRLEVVHVAALTPAGCPDMATVVRRVGGHCAGVAAGRVDLRVVADHAVLEAFAGSGEALATRVYGCGGDSDRQWSLFALGDAGASPVPAAAGWAMGVGWEEEEGNA